MTLPVVEVVGGWLVGWSCAFLPSFHILLAFCVIFKDLCACVCLYVRALVSIYSFFSYLLVFLSRDVWEGIFMSFLLRSVAILSRPQQ